MKKTRMIVISSKNNFLTIERNSLVNKFSLRHTTFLKIFICIIKSYFLKGNRQLKEAN